MNLYSNRVVVVLVLVLVVVVVYVRILLKSLLLFLKELFERSKNKRKRAREWPIKYHF